MKHVRPGTPTLPQFERQAAMQDVRKKDQSQQKKQYKRPKLVVHGPVESMTQQSDGGPSAAIVSAFKRRK
jgi:hypothetical protein